MFQLNDKKKYLLRKVKKHWRVITLGFMLTLSLSGISVGQAWSGVIDTSRAIDWTQVGLQPTFGSGETTINRWTPPSGRTQCITTQCQTVTTNAGASTVAQINTALVTAPAKTFVLLPPGTYNMSSNITMFGNNYVTLRGSGPMSTIINMSGANTEFQFGTCCSGGTFGFLNSTSYTKGTTNVTITGVSSTGALVAGNMAWFTQTDTNKTAGATVNVCHPGDCPTADGRSITATSGQPFTASMIGQTIVVGAGAGASFTVATVPNNTHLTLTTAATVADNVPAYVGNFNDPWPAGPTPIWICDRDYPQCTQQIGFGQAAGPFNSLQQDVVITAASCTANCGGGNQTWSVTFTPGLYSSDWSSNNVATMNWQNLSGTSIGMGLENMTINFAFNVFNRIDFENTYNSWVTGNRVIGYPSTSSIQIGLTTNSVVKDNYFFGNNFNNFWSAIGEPLVIGAGDGNNIFQNNIVTGGLCHWGEGHSVADIIAYDYCRDAQTPDYQTVSLDHDSGVIFRLIEATYGGREQSDNTHGTHDLNTYYRIRATGEDVPITLSNTAGLSAVQIDNYQRMLNIIGSVLGGPKSTTYQGTGSGSGNIFTIATGDTLTASSLFRYGNWDIIHNAVQWNSGEVPTSLSGNASTYQNAVPANHDLPCTLYLGVGSKPCVPKLSGGTGLSWWKVCTNWTSFPTGCNATQTTPFPPNGPELTGGPDGGGFSYPLPANIAYNNLPNDPNYQIAYPLTSATWSGGVETIVVNLSSMDNGSSEHTMGPFRLCNTAVANVCTVPVAAACVPASGLSFTGRSDNEVYIRSVSRGATNTTITYDLPINPGAANCNVNMLYPDIRMYDQSATYLNDPIGGPPSVNSGTLNNGMVINNGTVIH